MITCLACGGALSIGYDTMLIYKEYDGKGEYAYIDRMANICQVCGESFIEPHLVDVKA